MTRLWALVAGGIGAFALVASAHAADPGRTWRPAPPPEPEYEKPEPKFRELMSGWYLRGDLGYRWNKAGSITSATPTTSRDYDNSIALGVGFGYKYQWFRADVTIDRGGPSRISASTAAGGIQPQYSAKINAVSVLANAYIDLGTWAGFTPYIGAGAGIAELRSESYVDSNHLPDGTITGPGKQQNFAWAWMAGVAFQVQPSWVVDVGFRHLNLGDLIGANGAGVSNNAAIFRNLSAQEVRVGVRYLFE